MERVRSCVRSRSGGRVTFVRSGSHEGGAGRFPVGVEGWAYGQSFTHSHFHVDPEEGRRAGACVIPWVGGERPFAAGGSGRGTVSVWSGI